MFPFLFLPREIRDKIYGYLFDGSSEVKLLTHTRDLGMVLQRQKQEDGLIFTHYLEYLPPDTASRMGFSQALPLLRTCKLVQSEAAASLYGRNSFAFPCDGVNYYELRNYGRSRGRKLTGVCVVTDMLDFLVSIGPLNRKAIRSIQLHIPDIFSIPHPRAIYLSEPFLGADVVDIFGYLSEDDWLGTLEFRIHQPPPPIRIDTPSEKFVLRKLLGPPNKSRVFRQLMEWAGPVDFKVCDGQGRVFSLPTAYRPAYEALRSHLAQSRQREVAPVFEGEADEMGRDPWDFDESDGA